MKNKETSAQLNARLDKTYPKKDRQARCVVSDGKVSACWTLSAATGGYGFENRKGILVWSTINTETGKQASSFYGVKSGEFVKSGLIFNHCPFCGTEIHTSK